MSEPWMNAKFIVWQGYDYGTGKATPCPEPGETGHMGYEWKECRPGETADVVEVPYTCWGDYVGSTVERSNFRSLVEEYPDTFIEVYGGYDSHVLYLPTFKLTREIKELVNALFDYPLVNDEDHSMLEIDLAWEAWDDWLRYDLFSDLVEYEGLDPDEWTNEEVEFVRERYYAIAMENTGPVCEDAVSAYFPNHDETTETLAVELQTLGFEHDPRRPNPNQLEMEV
jgi:hypothetical protein